MPVLSLAQEKKCTSSQQHYGQWCLSQRMIEYLVCLEKSGGNQETISNEISMAVRDSNKLSGGVTADGKIIKGGVNGSLNKQSEQKLESKLRKTFYSGAMKSCSEMLTTKHSIYKSTKKIEPAENVNRSDANGQISYGMGSPNIKTNSGNVTIDNGVPKND